MGLWRKLSLGFAAGALGAVANVAFVAIVAGLGISAALDIQAPRPPMPAFLYKQIVWGGLWGFLLVLPVLSGKWWQRGLILGLLASLVAMLIFLPRIVMPPTAPFPSPGIFGLGWGAMMPVLILVANSVWGLVSAWWYARMTRE